jgi:hypothetical protein
VAKTTRGPFSQGSQEEIKTNAASYYAQLIRHNFHPTVLKHLVVTSV